MNRLANWRTAFFDAISAHRPYPFEWGAHDCALLTADCIKAVVGLDLAEPFRGRYQTQTRSLELLRELGYRDTAAILAEHFQEIHPSQAIVGDAALIPLSRRRRAAVAPVVGAELVVFAPGGPMGLVSLTEASRAFRIEIGEN
jgi:hypothetical protein